MTSRDVKGFTPLHWAAYFGHEAVLELLLENEKLRESWSCDLVDLIHGVAGEEGKILRKEDKETCSNRSLRSSFVRGPGFAAL